MDMSENPIDLFYNGGEGSKHDKEEELDEKNNDCENESPSVDINDCCEHLHNLD